jgi:hypothetical protein
MCAINHFKKFVLCSCDVAADVNHLYVKRIHLEYLVDHLYIVREDRIMVLWYVSSWLKTHYDW